VDLDLIRKIERGAIYEPGFFTVVDLARGLGADLGRIAEKTFLRRATS